MFRMNIKKKHLAKMLSQLDRFEKPKANLEQYVTPGDVASELLWMAYSSNNIEKKTVADLGCGTGVMTIGSALLGARVVYGVEIDIKALETARRNIKKAGVEKSRRIILMHEDVKDFNKKVDTVIMNPPFGCQQEHADRIFLSKSFEIGENVFSIHLSKPEVREFIENLSKKNNFSTSYRDTKKFDLPAQFFFHKKKLDKIDVDLYWFKRVP